MPLYKVEELAEQFIDRGWIRQSHHCRSPMKLKIKTELLVMGSLAMLAGTVNNFRQLPTVTNICATDHSKFFLLFVDRMESISSEWIYLPRNELDVKKTMDRYEEVGLPGAIGSIDVVHVRWRSCPAGDFNRSKGKEGFPSLAFECITDYDRRINGVFGPQFGTQNDKHIVKWDPNGASIRQDFYSRVKWNYHDENGEIASDIGLYLICDNGYLQWPTTICPYMRSHDGGRLEDYFSTNLASVRKDVECVFGILKIRWQCLDKGFKHRDITVCRKIFVTCCILHNMMLDEMVRDDMVPRVGRGCSIGTDGIWLSGHTTTNTDKHTSVDRRLQKEFYDRRQRLAHHLRHWKEKLRT